MTSAEKIGDSCISCFPLCDDQNSNLASERAIRISESPLSGAVKAGRYPIFDLIDHGAK